MYCQVWWYSKVRKQFEHPTNQVLSSGFTQLDFHLSGTSTLTHFGGESPRICKKRPQGKPEAKGSVQGL